METGRGTDGARDGERADDDASNAAGPDHGVGAGDVDVCVVGAGPVGLTLAIGLRRLALRVRIVDKAPATKHEARALVLWARAREALDALGVGETLARHGVELGVVTIHARGRQLGELTTGWARSAHARPLNIEQHDIERLLCEELARLGTRVEWNTEATDVKVHDDRAEFTLRHEDGTVESAAAPWIVGCEGTASVVRDRLGIPFEGRRRTGLQVVQGNAHPTWRLGEEPGRGHIFLAPHRSLLVFPLPGGGYRFFCFRDDPDPSLSAAPTLGELRDLVAETAGMPDLRLGPTEIPWLNRARFSDRVAATLRCGRGLLAGDAAHAWAPVGGHGMNVGILGAHNLAWKLAAVHHGQAGEELLDTYSDEQRQLAVRYIREMRFNFMELPLPPLGFRAFTATVPAALARRGFQRRLDLRLSDLGRNHTDSALSWHRPGRHRRSGPRAGERMPDVTVTTCPTDPTRPAATRLHTLLGYERWTLVLHAARAHPGVLDELRDTCAWFPAPVRILPVTPWDGAGAGRLGHPDDLRLVRPDGYVGLVAPLARTALLRDYLAAIAADDPGAVRESRPTRPHPAH
ncbi:MULTISPECIES: FAD-dependent monooxygenase [unclassified Streptomyces]|uniref:FAD-dependent monooxygenase n=1 Tax=unclassified Streptomyces TaxID=2593676 RepID=UPI0016564A10|nr:FAD-dependent monooxygenase [Streptomyces sp. CB02980]MCB8904520.1 FAD-dependent monooxygenase [Streptomyces sp. CB02980]